MPKFLYSIVLTLIVSTLLNPQITEAQDLIERAQMGIPVLQDANTPINGIANNLEQRKKSATSQSNLNNFAVFQYGTQSQLLKQPNLTKGVVLDLQAERLTAMLTNMPSLISMTIPVGEQTSFELELYQIDIHAAGFKVVTSSPVQEELNPQGVFYNGIVRGDNNSVVAVSIFEGGLDIFIQDKDGNYKVTKDQLTNTYTLYNDINRLNKIPYKCGTNASHQNPNIQTEEQIVSQSTNEMMGCVQIYMEADHALFTALGSVSAVTDYINIMMTQAIAVYESINVPITMSELFVHTTADPYPEPVFEKLGPFASAKQNNFNGNLAHLITGDGGGGQAFLDALCSKNNPNSGEFPFGVSGVFIDPNNPSNPNPNVGDFITFLHELGHNFGSPHTQTCVWNGNNTAIDGCVESEGSCPRPNTDCPTGGGTIMSYCHVPELPLTTCNSTTNWHPQVVALIQQKYAAATCLTGICGGEATCETDLTVNSGTTGSQSASNTITTVGTVITNGTVVYQAGNTITLNAGFTAAAGFSALIGECSTGGNTDGTCNAPHVLTCGQVTQGTNENGQDLWNGYPESSDHVGPEVVYTIMVPGNSSTVVTLSNLSADLDLIYADACSNSAEQVSSNPNLEEESVTISNTLFFPVLKYVIVDGWNGAIGTFDLSCASNFSNQEPNATSRENYFASTSERPLTIYPNPSNGETTISFNITESGNMELELYSNTGVLLKNLTNNQWMESGNHIQTISTEALQGGFYYVVLQTGKQTITKKLLILK